MSFPREEDVKNLSSTAVRNLLRRLIRALDESDAMDTFGTEGWRRGLLGEDA